MSDRAWLALGLMLFTIAMVNVGCLIVLGIVMPRDPAGWLGLPPALALGIGFLCVIRGVRGDPSR